MQYGDEFEWDDRKAELNRAKHGISFERAMDVFEDGQAITLADPKHSRAEERYVTIGRSWDEILIVVYTVREGRIRIISARLSNRNERRRYLDRGYDMIKDEPIQPPPAEEDDDMLPEYDFSKGVRGKPYRGNGHDDAARPQRPNETLPARSGNS